MNSITSEAQQSIIIYRQYIIRRWIMVFSAFSILIVSILIDLMTGPACVPFGDVLAALLKNRDVSETTLSIVVEMRLPVALMAVLVGASLALAGAEMQTILANPLAEPFTLGVASSAALGASLAIVIDVTIPAISPEWFVPANAFVFALGSIMLLLLLSRACGTDMSSTILFGIAIGLFASTVLSVLQYIASPDTLQQVVFWSMGSFSRADWHVLPIMFGTLLGTAPFSLAASWKLNALRLGEDRAASFGVNVKRLRFFALLRISLLAAVAVSFAGVIGFIGLVGPHIARMLVGEDHRFFLSATILTGALVMSLASIASKVIIPGIVLPIGLVTSIVGLPVFTFLIVSRRRRGR